MSKNVFYVYRHLSQATSDIAVDVSSDVAFASIWLGSVMKHSVESPSSSLNIARIKKGIKILNSLRDQTRYVWLKGNSSKKMYEFLKVLKSDDILETIEKPDYVLLKMKDGFTIIDRISYLSELDGIIYDLNSRGLVSYQNSKRRRLYSDDTLDIYKLLSNIPNLNYEEYRRIKLIKDLKEKELEEVLKYLNSKLVLTTLEKVDDFRFRGEKSSKDIFEALVKKNKISRIHTMSFQVARLLAS
jgi:hypothetical protein